MSIKTGLAALLITASCYLIAQQAEPVDGDYYHNPIIHADYSDPDVVRTGDDFYMVASSFNCSPALPVLHSRDLVNWKIINHVFDRQQPEEVFERPQHGNGVWAAAIRFQNGWYYVYYGDPDYGIYMSKTKDPAAEWEEPVLVASARGWIDPCPFWDEDGKAYLVHAFAGSRAGIKSVLVMHEMSPDGTELLDDGVLVFDGHAGHPTIEGPKMYKRNGYYYIMAPAGGVATGWQTVLRSENVFGPYEIKTVMHQGHTDVNGPHQGAWVELSDGSDWFVHFQEKQPYGRIVHLQPAKWEDDWLMIGHDTNGDGIGEPVQKWSMPIAGTENRSGKQLLREDFNGPQLGLAWQWQANPEREWAFPGPYGYLRLNPAIKGSGQMNLWDAPYLLLQKLPAERFTVTAKVYFEPNHDEEETGLVVMGRDYAYVSLVRSRDGLNVKHATCQEADQGAGEKILELIPHTSGEVYFRVQVDKGGICQFSFSTDGRHFRETGEKFRAREGKWIGAKVGLFCHRDRHENNGGFANYDWFEIETTDVQ